MNEANEKKWLLYVHITPCGKRYYGITEQKPKKRWANGKGYKRNKYFTRAIEKYGWTNITHEILAEDLTKYEAAELEKYMIQWYDTANEKYGYNLSRGGEGGNSGCERTEEWNHNISKANKGKQFSEEHKQKISETQKGENNSMYGKHHSKEIREKMSESRRGKNHPRAKSVICLTTKKIFLTAKEGAGYYNLKSTGDISGCCKGKSKSAGKYNGQKLVWRYLNHNHNYKFRVKEPFVSIFVHQ